MKGPQLKARKTTWALGGLVAVSLAVGAAFGVPAVADDTGFFGSVTVQRHAEDAARSWQKGDYHKAMNTYRKCIGLDPKEQLFYFGLYASAARASIWDQAAFAVEQLVEQDPSYKTKLNYEYGEVLYHQNRYDEAVPLLKAALVTADQESIVKSKLKSLIIKSIPPVVKPEVGGSTTAPTVPVAPIVPEKPVERTEKKSQEEVRPDTSDTALNFQNAFKSESITLCEYEGYDKKSDISFYNPPTARYHITKILKGPPLNRSLPIRYEFHDKTEAVAQVGALNKKVEVGKMPVGWKFGPDKMPTKGSRWIIFIQNAVPRRDGSFDTYQGSYGRQEASEDNLNQIYRIIEEHKGQQ